MDAAQKATPKDETMVSGEPIIYRDPRDWKGYASMAAAIIAVVIAVGGVVKHSVSSTDLEKFQKTYHEPLQKRVDLLEVSRDSLSKELGTMAGSINVLKVQIASVETGQTRVEGMLRDSTAELKTLVRDIANKLERFQSGRLQTPQHWWEDEWPPRQRYQLRGIKRPVSWMD